MARELQKGILYFLKLEDPAGGTVPPFYKIGITTGTLDKRINTLQTGNPYKIVPHHTMEVEGAEFVERHLHSLYSSKRRMLEWFEFTSEEIEEAIEVAKDYAQQFSDLVVEIRSLDQRHSNGINISATPEVLDLHKEALRLEELKTKLGLERSAIKSRLLSLVGTSRGIPGIVRVSIYKGTTSFKMVELRKNEPDVYDKYLTKVEFSQTMKLSGKSKPSDFKQLYEEKKAAAALIKKVEASDVGSDKIDRDTSSVALHEKYVQFIEEIGKINIDLDLVKMKLKSHCGENSGIDDVCTYIREDKKKFDREKFEADHPHLVKKYTTTGSDRRVVQVSKSRDY